MSDGTITEQAPSAPVLVAEPAPALDLLAPLAPEPVAAPVIVEQPVIAPILAPVQAPEFQHHSEVPTLLSDPEEKPVLTPIEPRPIETLATPVIPDTYEIEAPTDIRVTDADRQRMTAAFRDIGLTSGQGKKASAAYYAELKLIQASEDRRHQDAFMAMRRGWVAQIKGTPETIEQDGKQVPNPNHVPPHAILGNPGALKSVALMRDKLVPDGDRGAWREMCGLTGAGDHPALALMVYRAHEREEKLIAEYEAKIAAAVAAALEPYQESRAPTVRGQPVRNPNQDPGVTGFAAFYEKNSATR